MNEVGGQVGRVDSVPSGLYWSPFKHRLPSEPLKHVIWSHRRSHNTKRKQTERGGRGAEREVAPSWWLSGLLSQQNMGQAEKDDGGKNKSGVTKGNERDVRLLSW